MTDPKDRAGTRESSQRPPAKLFIGLGAVSLGINHLSVVFGNDLVPEALVMGCWAGVMGSWWLFDMRSFDAVWGWARPYAYREIGLGLFTLIIAIGLAEAVAWFAYGQHVWN